MRLVAAHVESRDAGGFFEHRAAIGRLGSDDVGDLALTDQRGTVRAGRGVGKDQRDILGAHIAAIGAIRRSCAAFDAADHLKVVAVARIRQAGDKRAFGVAV